MSPRKLRKVLPVYRGEQWLDARLPARVQEWTEGKARSVHKRRSSHRKTCEALREIVARHDWKWPKRPVYFFADPHADTDALLASLVASGALKKTGPADRDFKLVKPSREGFFIVGGDCFDKGPSNLRLLRCLNELSRKGMNFRFLAGNHDLRVLLGMRSIGAGRNEWNQHFFVRMGPKAIPLLREIHDEYLRGRRALKNIPGKKECRRLLFPSEQWLREFPQRTAEFLSRSALERELARLGAKIERFEENCEKAGLGMREVYAAALKWQALFLHPGGEFSWFFDRTRLAYHYGSFLFIHAGIDDHIAATIRRKGLKCLNRRFRKKIRKDDLEFYYSALVNTIRTKYRAVDWPLSRKGTEMANAEGIHVVIHGHRNLYHGQRISLRKNMINFECDTTMDINSRRKEGLAGPGAGVTIVRPEGIVVGISTDHSHIKVFDPLDFSGG
jgi:hypothetical protein